MMRITQISLLVSIFCGMASFSLFAQNDLSVEGTSRDVTLNVRGPEKKVDYVNPADPAQWDNCLILLSDAYGKKTGIRNTNQVAVQVDEKMTVTRVVNVAGSKGERPAFNESPDIDIPSGGFVLIAKDDSYSTRGFKRFLAENFKVGDVIKLRMNGDICALDAFVSAGGKDAPFGVKFDTETLFTSLLAVETISGKLVNMTPGKKYQLSAVTGNKTVLKTVPGKDGKFILKVSLKPGVNYIDVTVSESGQGKNKTSFAIYSKKRNTLPGEVVMWVEQFPNAKTLTGEPAIEEMVLKSKNAGVTAFGIDVKGPEGYVSYKKNDLSKSPYFTSTINPNKQVEPSDMDLLESFIKIAHKHGLKVYTSFNFFTEGNVTASDYALLKEHPDWEEIVQRPEDKGKLMKISESAVGQEARAGKRVVLGFVNPANREVQDFQLLRVEEVLKNYDIDGVVMDRCRYDNLYADFSEVSRKEFAAYLQKEGKTLDQFPADAFLIDGNGKMIEGRYFTDWITFRSGVIKQFTDRVRSLVDKYKKEKNPGLKLAAYVGSWFEVYWQNGVNWSSRNFRYDDRLNFPESRLYTDKYYQTSYTGNIDFLMIGTYYKTEKEVNKYITLGNILTNGELPLYGSMSLPDLKPEEQAEVFKASLVNSSGLMLFDLCYVDWTLFPDHLRKALAANKNNKK